MEQEIVPVVQNNIIPFSFEGMRLKESCWIGGKPYFTPRSIGEWLEAKNPQRYVRFIIERNPHIRQFATMFKLNIVEGGREVVREIEVYDPVGLQLIINKSNQPKAITFQIVVAHLVWALMNGELKPSKWSQKGDLISAARQILSAPPTHKRKELIADLAQREGISMQQAYRRIVMATGERLLTGNGIPKKSPSTKGFYKNRPEYQKVMEFIKEHPEYLGMGNRFKGFRKKDIKSILGLTVSCGCVNRWIREYVSGH